MHIDNHFNGVGLHGVYDSKYDRIIITKHDYVPKDANIKYDSETDEYYIEEEIDIDIPDCYLWGEAIQMVDCEIEGEAQEITTTTTTLNPI